MYMSASAQSDEARLLRFPATNGTEIVFSYAGDLFTVPVTGGQATRLTSHIGYEMFARYSFHRRRACAPYLHIYQRPR